MAKKELGRGVGSAWGPAPSWALPGQDGHSGHWKGLSSIPSSQPESAGLGRGAGCPGDEQ